MDRTEEHHKGFSERLKTRRKNLWLSQKQLSEHTGISHKTIQKFENKNFPQGPNLIRLSQVLDCSIDWLLLGSGAGGVDPDQDGRPPDKEQSVLKTVPKVYARLDTNAEVLEKNQNIRSEYAFNRDWLSQKGDLINMVLMEVPGDSMSPELKNGDTVLIDQGQREIYIDKIYAVSIGKEVMIRYVERTPGKIILRGANSSWNNIEVDVHKDIDDPVKILGRVIWWCREIN